MADELVHTSWCSRLTVRLGADPVYRAAARRTDLVILRGADLGLQAVLPFYQTYFYFVTFRNTLIQFRLSTEKNIPYS